MNEKRLIKKGGSNSGGNSFREKFRGICSYAKVYKPDDYLGDKKWKVNLHPDEDTIARIKEAGIQLKLHESNEEHSGVPGRYFTFNRPCEKEFNGEVTYFSPPDVYFEDGSPLATYTEVKDGWEQEGPAPLVGNGSEVEIDVTVYKTKRFGKGCRINYMTVLDLVEYTPPEELSDNEVDEEEDSTEGTDSGKARDPQETTKVSKPAARNKKTRSKVDW